MDNMQTMDMEYKPWGGLAGVYSGIEQAQAQQSNENKLVGQGLENTIKGVEAGRVMSDYSNPELEQWRQRDLIGKGMKSYSEGKGMYDTLDQATKTKLLELKSKANAEEFNQEKQGLMRFITTATDPRLGPLGMQKAVSELPPNFQQVVKQLETNSPGSSVKEAKRILDLYTQLELAGDTKHQGSIGLEGVKHTNTMAQNAAKDAAHMERTKFEQGASTARTNAEIAARKEIELAKASAKKAVLEQAKNEFAQFNKDNEAYLKDPTPENAAKLRMSYSTYKMKLQSQILNKPDLQSMGIEVMSMPADPPALQGQTSTSSSKPKPDASKY